MNLKKIFRLALILLFVLLVFDNKAQTCLFSIKGLTYDLSDSSSIPNAKIILFYNDSTKIKEVFADLNGVYLIDSLQKGIYSLKILYVGYKPIIIKDILVGEKKVTIINIGFTDEIKLDEIKVDYLGGYVSFIDSLGFFRCVKKK